MSDATVNLIENQLPEGLPANGSGRSWPFRILFGFLHAAVGFMTAVLSVSHKCDKQHANFEFLIVTAVTAGSFLLVIATRRYRYAFIGGVILLYVAWNIGQYYIYIMHHP
ncbi:MAG: hypothetical protein NT013_20595 [Planctomycetia bacterium]|nr:hypothetical protein [Planctomycetia bacterium]